MRREDDWVYGKHSVKEALLSGKVEKVYLYKAKPDRELLKLARALGVPVNLVDKNFFKGLKASQGVAARIAQYNYWDISQVVAETEEEKGYLLMVDSVYDPRNLGALLRSAAAFKASGVLIPKKGATGVNATVIKTSAGGAFKVKVSKVGGLASNLSSLRRRGFETVALDIRNSNLTLWEYEPNFPLVLIVGGEEGLRSTLLSEADYILRIPIDSQVESLNLVVAASIAMAYIYKHLLEGRRG